MPCVITFVDGPGVRERKQRLRPTHVEYVERNAHRTIASGGFLPEEDGFPNGGLITLDAADRDEAVGCIENDPFHTNGIVGTDTIAEWRKFIPDHKSVPA